MTAAMFTYGELRVMTDAAYQRGLNEGKSMSTESIEVGDWFVINADEHPRYTDTTPGRSYQVKEVLDNTVLNLRFVDDVDYLDYISAEDVTIVPPPSDLGSKVALLAERSGRLLGIVEKQQSYIESLLVNDEKLLETIARLRMVTECHAARLDDLEGAASRPEPEETPELVEFQPGDIVRFVDEEYVQHTSGRRPVLGALYEVKSFSRPAYSRPLISVTGPSRKDGGPVEVVAEAFGVYAHRVELVARPVSA